MKCRNKLEESIEGAEVLRGVVSQLKSFRVTYESLVQQARNSLGIEEEDAKLVADAYVSCYGLRRPN